MSMCVSTCGGLLAVVVSHNYRLLADIPGIAQANGNMKHDWSHSNTICKLCGFN